MGGWQSTMTKAGVMILLVLATFTITQVDLRRVGARSWPCEDYTCNHNGPESRIVYPGERCEYRVQPFGFDSYPPPRGVDCVVDYYPGDGCKQLVFNCKSLHLHNPHPVTCHGPDKMNVYNVENHAGADTFCGSRTPNNVHGRPEEYLKIQTIIDHRTPGGQGSRDCNVQCVEY